MGNTCWRKSRVGANKVQLLKVLELAYGSQTDVGKAIASSSPEGQALELYQPLHILDMSVRDVATPDT